MVEVTVPRRLLARGRTADVFAWRDGYVLKVFHDWFALDSIKYEARIGRAVHAAGLPAPLPGELLRVHGHNALVYERVDGPSMAQAMMWQPWRIVQCARRLARLHARLHASPFAADVPPQRESIERSIRGAPALPAAVQAKALAALASLPDGDRLCHGDLHPGNVLVTARGDLAIDWGDATVGNPLADVARSSIIMLGDQVAQPLLSPFSRSFHAAYLSEYFHLRPGGEPEYRRWLPVMAAARLNEGISSIEEWLLQQAEAAM